MLLQKFEDLKGNVCSSVIQDERNSDDELVFTLQNGEAYKLYHSQDCCENVYIEDIEGNLEDLVGVPILQAEEVQSGVNPDGVEMGYQDSFTWTFYKLATIKGYVTIRWYGESNGYYSESVDWTKI